MSLVQIITILGSVPLFSMRTFLPAFLTALFLTYPEYFPGVDDVAAAPGESFLSRNWLLILLGILSLLEIIGDKSSEIRNLVKNAETYLKPVLFLLINLNLLDQNSTEILQEVQWAAFDPNWILLAAGTLAVHWLAGLRRDFINFLEDIDEDDNFMIGQISSWVEDSLVIFGFLLLIWTGILMVLLYAAAIAVLLFLAKRYEKKLDRQKIACTACGERNLPFAVKCYNCKEPQPVIHDIGVLGQKKERLVRNIQDHRLNLVSQRRCPDCGHKQEGTRIDPGCSKCGNILFESPTLRDFIKFQDKRFFKVTGLSFLLGFIPVVGFLVSAVIANIYLFTPYRRYIPRGSSFLTKLFIKFLTFLLFILGIGLGFIAAPVYIILRYTIWKRKFTARLK